MLRAGLQNTRIINMNDEQHIKLVEVGNHFYEEYSKLVAHALSRIDEEIREDAKYYLNEKSNVFSSNYDKYLK